MRRTVKRRMTKTAAYNYLLNSYLQTQFELSKKNGTPLYKRAFNFGDLAKKNWFQTAANTFSNLTKNKYSQPGQGSNPLMQGAQGLYNKYVGSNQTFSGVANTLGNMWDKYQAKNKAGQPQGAPGGAQPAVPGQVPAQKQIAGPTQNAQAGAASGAQGQANPAVAQGQATPVPAQT